MSAAGQPAGMLGTIHHAFGDNIENAALTTPEAPEINRLLRSMMQEGMKAAVMEVSSHGLALRRVEGLDFDLAIFTNFTRDHLDFHGTKSDYLQAKALLFRNLKADGHAILNVDDPAADALRRGTSASVITYAISHSEADVHPIRWESGLDGLSAEVRTPGRTLQFSSPLLGEFNLYNLLAAVAASLTLGLAEDAVVEGIANVKTIPGRAEKVSTGGDFTVLIDYAHTPNALENILQTAQELRSEVSRGSGSRIICIFGCGGERDKSKRPLMGRIAAAGAELVVVTSDNPRGEDPENIIADIIDGIERKENVIAIPGRREAIKRGISEAKENDIVLICGKGHETHQDIGGRKLPFSDKALVEELLDKQA